MTLSIAVVCEAEADRITITTLAERLILDAADWITPELLPANVQWRGFRAADPFLEWTQVKRHAHELGIVATFRTTQPRHPYSQNALRALRVLAAAPDPVDGMILVADTDNDLGRRDGFAQAREHFENAHLPLVMGLAHTKRECWHICGFEPMDDTETQRITELRQEVGFDFRAKSHELTAKHDSANDKRSAKRVLSVLTLDSKDRQNACLAVPFVILEQRGIVNGLCAFLKELRERLVPSFSGKPPEASG